MEDRGSRRRRAAAGRDPAPAAQEPRRSPAGSRRISPLSLPDHLAAVLARSRPQVHDPVGLPHHLLVVLDDEHGVAGSRSRSSISISFPLSRWWSPIDGSSRM